MALNQGYDLYHKNQIMTAASGDLTLMLYEGAIKFCNLAAIALEHNDIEKTHYNIMRVEDIIVELQATLNHKYPVAEDFDRIYKYIYELLVEANIRKDPVILERALKEIRGMRDLWKQIVAKNKSKA